jgi:hypothetical protein
MGTLVALFKLVLILDAKEYEAMCNDWRIPSDISKPIQSNALDDVFMSYKDKKISSFLKFKKTMNISNVPLHGICNTNEGQTKQFQFNASELIRNGFMTCTFEALSCVSLNISIQSGHTYCPIIRTTAPLPTNVESASRAVYAAMDCYALGFISANDAVIRREGECIKYPPELFISLSRIYRMVQKRTNYNEYMNTPNGAWTAQGDVGFLSPVFTSVATSFISQLICDIKTSSLVTKFIEVWELLRGTQKRLANFIEVRVLLNGT